eukprot:TRINITY_DN14656_c0_g1_i3.p1 TRINITY_DN14656_c0_g1~~TRINITY_DN14656_c0_g1_i3.p1  ORF type:complete len:319 (+),score=127.30 TRINITY_DN14656_c0_g1_i3:81-1037(+)
MIRRPPRSTLSSSSAASDVYKRQVRCRAQVCVVWVYAHELQGAALQERIKVMNTEKEGLKHEIALLQRAWRESEEAREADIGLYVGREEELTKVRAELQRCSHGAHSAEERVSEAKAAAAAYLKDLKACRKALDQTFEERDRSQEGLQEAMLRCAELEEQLEQQQEANSTLAGCLAHKTEMLERALSTREVVSRGCSRAAGWAGEQQLCGGALDTPQPRAGRVEPSMEPEQEDGRWYSLQPAEPQGALEQGMAERLQELAQAHPLLATRSEEKVESEEREPHGSAEADLASLDFEIQQIRLAIQTATSQALEPQWDLH